MKNKNIKKPNNKAGSCLLRVEMYDVSIVTIGGVHKDVKKVSYNWNIFLRGFYGDFSISILNGMVIGEAINEINNALLQMKTKHSIVPKSPPTSEKSMFNAYYCRCKISAMGDGKMCETLDCFPCVWLKSVRETLENNTQLPPCPKCVGELYADMLQDLRDSILAKMTSETDIVSVE